MNNLYNIVHNIEEISLKQPNIQLFYEGDVYKLNESAGIEYPAVVLTQQKHRYDANTGYIHYKFIMFYIDRLTDDNGNKLDIQSHGIEVLKDILRNVENNNIGFVLDNLYFNTFTERFEAECAGAFCELTVSVLEDICSGDDYYV